MRIGWKLKKLSAGGVATDITNLDAIVPTGGVYSIRKVDVVINNKTQFGSSVNRDYGPERRRMKILRGIGATMDDLELTYNRYNGFHPNVQTKAENASGKYQAYTEAAGVITGITDHTADMWDSHTKYCLALQERNARRLLEGKEVFNNIELAREGILGATSVFPGVITEFDLVVHCKPILEMFAEEAHTANTDAISSSYLEIMTVTVATQCTVPSTDLWKALRDASTAGGGKGSLPSYPAEVMDVHNGSRTFPVTSTTFSVPVTGSEVPDDVFLGVREQSNIATKRGSTAYLSLPDVKYASMTVATQVRHAFQHTGESPFSDSTSGVTSRASLDAKSATVKARYKEYFKDTVMKQMCIADGDDLNACNKYLYSPENWVNGNTIYVFHALTALSNEWGYEIAGLCCTVPV